MQKLELSFEEMQLHIADRHTTLTEKIEKMQRKFDDNNEKITENQKNVSVVSFVVAYVLNCSSF